LMRVYIRSFSQNNRYQPDGPVDLQSSGREIREHGVDYSFS
jgi:hypothetical protein